MPAAAAALRLSPAEGRDAELLEHLSALAAAFAGRPGALAGSSQLAYAASAHGLK